MNSLVFLVVSLLCIVGVKAAGIQSGVPWFDTAGNRLEAHGGGFLLANGVYYWYGESKKTSTLGDHGVNCYSSTDLNNWKFERQVLAQADIVGIPTAGPYVVERPHVLYNSRTSQYVMWFHLDSSNYGLRYVGVATADKPNGVFKFHRGFQPDGVPSLDQTIYQDSDGNAYHIRSCNNQYVGFSRLSADYLNTTGIIAKINDARESPAMFQYSGRYYLVTSHLTGWNPNPMELFDCGRSLVNAQCTSLGNPTKDSTTFNSQSTNVLIYKNTIIYQGDRWNYSGPGGLLNATYIWLPIKPTVAGDNFEIQWQASWNIA